MTFKRPNFDYDPKWFWLRVKKTKTCWLWQGARNNTGYGTLCWDEGSACAHRIAFRLSGYKVPRGYEVDHLCGKRHCVNPTHLEAVTKRVNILRGKSPSAIHARKKRCKRGHPFSGDNLIIRKRFNGSTQRVCRKCDRAYHNAYQRKWKAQQ